MVAFLSCLFMVDETSSCTCISLPSVFNSRSILQVLLWYVRVLELDLNAEKSTELLYDTRDRFTDEGRILHVEMTH